MEYSLDFCNIDLSKDSRFDSAYILLKMIEKDLLGLGKNVDKAKKCEDVFSGCKKQVGGTENIQIIKETEIIETVI